MIKQKNRKYSHIPLQEVAFIVRALESDSNILRKHALQRLCRLYRNGGRAANAQILKALVIAALTDVDEKVRRWAFNALAQIGTIDDFPLMLEPWKNSQSDTDVYEAGLTALAHILPKQKLLETLKNADVELDISTVLALAQQTDVFEAELAKLRLNIDTATDPQLRSATLLIGLKKAPDTLFSNRFPVSEVIGDLNNHNDPIIAQYSFWATVEHPSLGLENIRVRPNDFPKLLPNVQGWAYRILTKNNDTAARNFEALLEGSESTFVEVREGVATGLRDIYYQDLDVMVSDWYIIETRQAVKDRLLEHMAVFSSKSDAYREEVIKAYRASSSQSILRSRLEAANRVNDISLKFKRIALQTDDPDFFENLTGNTMNNTQNFHGTVNTGGLSNSGTGNQGNVQIMTKEEAHSKVLPLLEELKQALESENRTSETLAGMKLVGKAIDEPNKGKIETVIDWLKKIKDGGETASALGGLAVKLYTKIAPLVEFL